MMMMMMMIRAKEWGRDPPSPSPGI